LERAADSLLLLTAGNRRGEATGKLYEYLSAGRPILVLGDRTEAARIVADAGAGIAVAAEDPGAVAAALERLVAGEVQPRGAPPEYGYPALAARLAQLVDVAVQRAAARK
jgi:glycosyltransferase involved in cell wall biosynthesis